MKFGLNMGVSHREPLTRAAEIVCRAEEAGFDCFYFIDSQLIVKDVFVTLTLCAQKTKRILLGTGVTNPVTRDLTVLASAFSALQEVSSGRAVIGMGSGGSATESIGYKPATVREIEGSIRVLRGLLGQEVVQYRGKEVRLLTSQGPIPIFISASQPKMLSLAGKLADGVIVMGSSIPHLVEEQISFVLAGLKESGRERKDLIIDLWQTIAVSDDRKTALNDVKPWVASQSKWWWSRASEMPTEISAAVREDEIKQATLSYDIYEHLSRNAGHKDLVSDELANGMAIAGDASYCFDKLNALTNLGVDQITLSLLSGGRQERLETLSRLTRPLT